MNSTINSDEFHKWINEYKLANTRDNTDWYPQPSIFESFMAGFEAAKKLYERTDE